MSTSSPPEEPVVSSLDAEWLAAEKKFDDATELGHSAFFYNSWAAWSVVPKQKRIAPIIRVVFGDLAGNVLFDRPVVLTGVADLLNELSYTFLDQVTRASEFTGYSLDIPGEPSTMVKNLREAAERISAALDLLDKTDLFKTSEPPVEAPPS